VGPNDVGGLLGPALVGMIVNGHVGSLAREGDRGGAADAAIGARDERGLSLEQHSGLPMTYPRSQDSRCPPRATGRLTWPYRRKNGARRRLPGPSAGVLDVAMPHAGLPSWC
jgi:hypothetical protein